MNTNKHEMNIVGVVAARIGRVGVVRKTVCRYRFTIRAASPTPYLVSISVNSW